MFATIGYSAFNLSMSAGRVGIGLSLVLDKQRKAQAEHRSVPSQVDAAQQLNSCLHAKLYGATKQMMGITQDIAAWEVKFKAVNSENERLAQEAAALAQVSLRCIDILVSTAHYQQCFSIRPAL